MKCLIVKAFILLLWIPSVACGASEKNGTIEHDETFVIEGRVNAMSGACNAIKCPIIQYTVATTKIRKNPIDPAAPDARFAMLRVCGESGLLLGRSYVFFLKAASEAFDSDFDRPMAEGGGILFCDFLISNHLDIVK